MSSLCRHPAGAEISEHCPRRWKDLIEHPVKTQVPLDLCRQQQHQWQTSLEVSWGFGLSLDLINLLEGTAGKTDPNWDSPYGRGPNYSYKRIIVWLPGYFFILPSKYQNIISTASSFGRIGVGLWTKDRNPTSWILPQILPQELLRLQDLERRSLHFSLQLEAVIVLIVSCMHGIMGWLGLMPILDPRFEVVASFGLITSS